MIMPTAPAVAVALVPQFCRHEMQLAVANATLAHRVVGHGADILDRAA